MFHIWLKIIEINFSKTVIFYYKLGQALLQIGAAQLLQIGASVITNWGRYYKLGQNLLQIGAGITNWGNYYKLGHNSWLS